MTEKREIVEGIQYQGIDEQIYYTITTTPWGASPFSVSMVVKDVAAGLADVTSTVSTGSASVAGDVITLPVIKSLTDITSGHFYRVEVKFTSGGNVFECYFRIQAER